MNLTSRESVVALLRRHGLRPDRRLGQNFLIDPIALERVISAAGLGPADIVLEVGAGLGTLTLRLSQIAGRVVAVEFDRRLAPALAETVGSLDNIELIYGDILGLNIAEAVGGRAFKVVSNIPYQITSHLIRLLLEAEPRPSRMVLTVQREVAERIVGGPGEMSLLSLGVQAYGEPRVAAHISPEAFYPAPKVASSIVVIDVHEPARFSQEGARALFRLARAGFSQPRKKLRNSLAAGLHVSPARAEERLTRAGISPSSRAEALSLADWANLAEVWPLEPSGDRG